MTTPEAPEVDSSAVSDGSERARQAGLQNDPFTSAGIAETLGHLERIIRFTMNSMANCEPKLNLSTDFHTLRSMLGDVSGIRAGIAQAATIIETSAPLAMRFPGDDASWASHGKPLSPKQLVYLAALAVNNPDAEHTAYDGVADELTIVPSYITYASEQKQIQAEIQNAMNRPCPRCGECLTNGV